MQHPYIFCNKTETWCFELLRQEHRQEDLGFNSKPTYLEINPTSEIKLALNSSKHA